MSNGIKAFRQIQMSRETLSATTDQGAPTTDNWVNWRGLGTLDNTLEMIFPNEDIGYLSGVDRSYTPKLGGELVFDEIEANFEQLPHILDAGIYMATPTTDTGTGSGYIRTYTFPTISSGAKSSTDLQTYYFKCGDNNEVEEFGFAFVKEFTLRAGPGEAWKLTATWEGREVTTSADGFETISYPTVEEMMFTKSKLYLDVTSDTIGTSEVASTLLGAEVNVKTGWQAVYNASGRSDFGYIKQVQPEITINVTFEHNASASAEKAYWRAATARLMRIKVEGSALTAAGAYTYKTHNMDFAGKWENFEKLGEQNGNDIVTGTFRARYNSTASKFAVFTLVNEVATL